MKFNKWTVALAATGLVSLSSVALAEESSPTAVMTALSSTTLSGYVDTSINWNLGTGNDFSPPYSFGGAGKADGFNLNVVKLALEKPVDAGDEWGSGYKVDLLFGPDANAFATQSSGEAADFAVKQAYVALRAPVGNGINMKIGVWDTVLGYEVFESGNNPNYTRSYGYTIEPTTHTGLHAQYAFNDVVSVAACIANTFGPRINERAFSTAADSDNSKAESYKTYMGMVTLTAPESWGSLAGSTLTGCVINGFNESYEDNQTSWYLGASLNTPVKGLKVGAAFDFLRVHNRSVAAPGTAGEVWVAGLYSSYQATEKLSLHLRGEYLKDQADFFSFTASDGSIKSTAEVFEVTATAQYDLWKNVISRLEIRWDHAANGRFFGAARPADFSKASTGSSEVGSKKNEVLVAANIIYKF